MAGFIGLFLGLKWQQDAPRRAAVRTLQRFETALNGSSSEVLLDFLVVPAAIHGRIRPEQAEFIRKDLQNEISPDGLEDLKKNGQFGPLKKLFPTESVRWVTQAGVLPIMAGICSRYRSGQWQFLFEDYRNSVHNQRDPDRLAGRRAVLPIFRAISGRVNRWILDFHLYQPSADNSFHELHRSIGNRLSPVVSNPR